MEENSLTTVYGRTSENWYKEVLPTETRVKFKHSPDDIERYGKIKGLSSNGITVIGRQYIVELDEESMFDKEIYDYPCVAVFEIYLEEIK